MTFVDASAHVEPGVLIGAGSRVWRLAQLRRGCRIGPGCTIGTGAFIDVGVVLGERVKVQNHALVYAPSIVEDGVFIGPAAVLTNDRLPRAVNPDLTAKDADDWDSSGVLLRTGCSIGARAVCVAPVVVGRWAMVAAGAVVTADVPDHALVMGVPARRVGWVGRAGARLSPEDNDGRRWRCPRTEAAYVRDGRGLMLERPA